MEESTIIIMIFVADLNAISRRTAGTIIKNHILEKTWWQLKKIFFSS